MTVGIIVGIVIMVVLYVVAGFATLKHRRRVKDLMVEMSFYEGRALGKKIRTAKRRRLRRAKP